MDSPGYCEINSNMTLDYINRILMEEDIDEKVSIHQRQDALQATEKPFYDILRQAYPSPPKDTVLNSGNQADCPSYSSNNHGRECSSSFLGDLLGPHSEHLITTDWASENDHLALQFWRGFEEANKFVPSIDSLVGLESNDVSISKQTTETRVGQKSKHANKTRNHLRVEDLESLEGRNSKHSANLASETIRDERFDNVLLCNGKFYGEVARPREMMATEANSNPANAQSKGHGQGRGKPRGRKQQKEVVDLRALLIHCAQAMADNNHPFARELLKKIRRHSSPHGDGSQRLASCFVDGLEARLAGTGRQVWQEMTAKRAGVLDMLEAYHLCITACPLVSAAYYYSNQTIVDVLGGRPRVHIVDFGIMFGFQWPPLIQRFAKREEGPPMLRITGIHFDPFPRIEETGKRLAEYADMFKVPFQYQGIASQWETVRIEDLSIHKDEVLIINCLYQMRGLGAEAQDMDSARDRVLRTMKRMNPDVFILGVVNGLYSSPFFLPRFREVLFHYSSLFDILDTNVPRDHEARILMERDLFGRDVLNVVACEGADRMERPESYRQWQLRNLRAGFKQIPVDQANLKRLIQGMKEFYHQDFVIDEDSGWLLLGWKGRILNALSSWKPKESYAKQ